MKKDEGRANCKRLGQTWHNALHLTDIKSGAETAKYFQVANISRMQDRVVARYYARYARFVSNSIARKEQTSLMIFLNKKKALVVFNFL